MNGYKIIGVLGDSITNGYWDEEKGGWFNRLAEHLKREKAHSYTFCNMAKGGDKSIDVCHRLMGEAAGRELDVLLVAAGLNDIVRSNGEAEMSESFRRMTWERILAFAKKNFPETVVFGLLPVLDGEIKPYGVFIYNKDIEAYNALIRSLCEKYGVKFYLPSADWQKSLYADNVHLNAGGHELYEQLAYRYLKNNRIIG